jgi:hypothetical protein
MGLKDKIKIWNMGKNTIFRMTSRFLALATR